MLETGKIVTLKVENEDFSTELAEIIEIGATNITVRVNPTGPDDNGLREIANDQICGDETTPIACGSCNAVQPQTIDWTTIPPTAICPICGASNL